VAVASAGLYASLHLAPCQHPTTRFLQAGCLSCRPTNSVRALKALLSNTKQTLKLITKNSRTVGGPLPPVGPPSLDAAATPSFCHWVVVRIFVSVRSRCLMHRHTRLKSWGCLNKIHNSQIMVIQWYVIIILITIMIMIMITIECW